MAEVRYTMHCRTLKKTYYVGLLQRLFKYTVGLIHHKVAIKKNKKKQR